jgi:hypothetical protein
MPDFRQQLLKAEARAAGTQIPPAELFDQLLIVANHAKAAFHTGFRGISFTALTTPLERRRSLQSYR